MTKRRLPTIAPVAILAGAVLVAAFTTGCSRTDSADQALSDARAAEDTAQQELTGAQQQITDLQAEVKDLK